ncbi:MAG: PqiC family protein [Bacteroidales bacterium]|nr:PqiC family protein [Bacteroidales bacterium]
MSKRCRSFFPALIALVLSGCVVPSSPAPDYYLLTAQAAPAQPGLAHLSLGVGPVRVAPFLERVQLVSHDGRADLDVDDSHRWAEPLDKGIQRVMVQNLAALTGAQTRNFPWSRSAIPQRALRIDVLDLNSRDDRAVLEVLWVVEDLSGVEAPLRGRERLEQLLDGDGPAARVLAYSRLLDSLAQGIAARLGQ